MIEPCTGETRERTQVDVAIVASVMTGDVAGQHARIGCMDVAGDQREAYAGQGCHAESLEYRHMGMPAADQYDVLDHGCRCRLHDENFRDSAGIFL